MLNKHLLTKVFLSWIRRFDTRRLLKSQARNRRSVKMDGCGVNIFLAKTGRSLSTVDTHTLPSSPDAIAAFTLAPDLHCVHEKTITLDNVR